uniref:Uncharacterized protein n=1 Tax=Trichinella nativa TaxID=6335 RepID=A0A0V1KJF4_9BILA
MWILFWEPWESFNQIKIVRLTGRRVSWRILMS